MKERRRRWQVCLAASAMLCAVPIYGASFNCARAKSPMEHAICSDKDLSASDSALSAAYRAALGQLQPDGVSKLRVDQLRWLQWLQTGCGVPGSADPSSPVVDKPARHSTEPNPAELAACMKEPYVARVDLLKRAVARIEGVTFLMRSMYLLQPNSADDTMGSPTFPGFGELEASWPEAQTTDATWLAWNKAVVSTMQRSTEQEGTVKEAWTPAMASGVDQTSAMTLPKLHAGRVHSDLNVSMMGHGAAHPNEEFQKFTWLLDKQRWMRASDVFVPGKPWQRVVGQECWRQLKRGENAAGLYDTVTGPQDKSVQGVIVDVRNWTITPEGLSISWPEYAVSPRVAPQDDTVVPWKLLQPYLQPGFQP